MTARRRKPRPARAAGRRGPAARAGSAGPDRWFFDLWSRFYDVPFVQRLAYRPVHDGVLAALRGRPVSSLLDVGCGTGLLTRRLRRALPEARVVGCDFSSGMLRRAARRAPKEGWVQGDALQLPFGDARFDAVVSTEAFHWFPDQRAALTELRRVLAPQGLLLLALASPPLEIVSRAARLASRLAGEPLYFPTRRRLRGWLEAEGFEVESQRRLFRAPAPIFFSPVLSVARRLGSSAPRPRSRRNT